MFRFQGLNAYRIEDFSYVEGEVVTAVLVHADKTLTLPRVGRWTAK